MKTFKGLFEQIAAFASLHAAWRRVKRGKRWHGDVLAFEADLEPNLFALQESLLHKVYATGPYRLFQVFEPKNRTVAALPIKDRVVQHSLVAVLERIWEPRFCADSFACRVGKGTHAGADRAQAMMRQVQRRHGRVVALKGDVEKFFPSISHDVLKRLIRRHVACAETLWLIDEIIDSTLDRAQTLPRGMPIGNLASQLFANIYLDALDRFVKQELRWPHYVRYVDDFVLFGADKSELHDLRLQIEAFLHAELALRTNTKTQVFHIQPRGRCLDFLGYRMWPTHRRLRNGCVRRFRRRLKGLSRRYAEGLVTAAEVGAVVQSWAGHARHANSWNLRGAVYADFALRRKESRCPN